jgi:anthranilate 1,2-dioxygenase ferredoxin subunit
MDASPGIPRRPSAASDDLAWHPVAVFADLPTDGSGITVELGKRAVAIFRVGEDVFALHDTCPHASASLGMGIVVDGEVACPWHSFHFDLRTGRNTDGLACRVKVHPVRLDADGRVEVGLPH